MVKICLGDPRLADGCRRGGGRGLGRGGDKARIEPQPSIGLLQNGRHEHEATTIVNTIIIPLGLRPFLNDVKHLHYPVLYLNQEADPAFALNQSTGKLKSREALFAFPSSRVSPHRMFRFSCERLDFHSENGFRL